MPAELLDSGEVLCTNDSDAFDGPELVSMLVVAVLVVVATDAVVTL